MDKKAQWIVSPRFDFFLFIVSPLAAVAFYGIYIGVAATDSSASSVTATTLAFFMVFTGIFDAPHIFQTFSRTHLDPTEYKRHRGLHIVAPLAAVGVALSCHYFEVDDIFLSLLAFYGAWHIVRQNVGFIKLYQKINRRLEPAINRFEPGLLYASLFYFYAHSETSLHELLGDFTETLKIAGTLEVLKHLSLALVILLGAFVLLQNLQVFRRTGDWNTPKMALIASSLLLVYWLSVLNVHPILMIALSTIGHDLQYQAWMWIYQKRRQQGLRKPLLTLGVCLLGGVLVMWSPDNLSVPYNGLVLWHYFIDGFIWRFGSSPELGVMSAGPL